MWTDIKTFAKNISSIKVPYIKDCLAKKLSVISIYKQANTLNLLIICSVYFANSQTQDGYKWDQSLRNLFYNVYQSFVIYLEHALSNCMKYEDITEKWTTKLANVVEALKRNKIIRSLITKDKVDTYLRRKNEFAVNILRNLCKSTGGEVSLVILKKLKELSASTKVTKKVKDIWSFIDTLDCFLKPNNVNEASEKQNLSFAPSLRWKLSMKLRKSAPELCLPLKRDFSTAIQPKELSDQDSFVFAEEVSTNGSKDVEVRMDVSKLKKTIQKKHIEILSNRNRMVKWSNSSKEITSK